MCHKLGRAKRQHGQQLRTFHSNDNHNKFNITNRTEHLLLRHLSSMSFFEMIDIYSKPKHMSVRMWSPVFVGDDAPLHLLVILADANSQPGTQLAIV